MMSEARERLLIIAKQVTATSTSIRSVASKSLAAAGVAETVSEGVRALDGRKTRVQRAISAGNDVIKLRSCVSGIEEAIELDDLEAASRFVGEFRTIERAAEAGGETYELELAAMRHSAAKVTALVKERYYEATAARDDEGVVRWIELLPMLSLVDKQCVEAYIEYWRCLLRDAVSTAIHESAVESTPALTTLQSIINAVAALTKFKLTNAAKCLTDAQGGRSVLLLTNEACEAAMLAVVARFVSERHLTSLAAEAHRDVDWPTSTSVMSLDELDGLLDDVSCALQRLETWRRFAAHSAAKIGEPKLFEHGNTRLAETAVELGGWYSTLESTLLRKTLQKADALDTTKELAQLPKNDAQTSSAADDAFYASRRCVSRALASGNSSTAAHFLILANEMLTSETLHDLSNRVHQSLAATSAAGSFSCTFGDDAEAAFIDGVASFDALQNTLAKGADNLAAMSEDLVNRSRNPQEEIRVVQQTLEASAEEQRRQLAPLIEAQIALNTLELACDSHLGRLRLDLQDELEESYGSKHKGSQQLEALVAELEPPSGGVAERFVSALAAAREAFASAIQRGLCNALAVGCASTPERLYHRWALDDEGFSDLEASDDFGAILGRAISHLVPRATNRLSRDNAAGVLASVAAAVGRRFESELLTASLRARISALGALQLDKDVRTLRTLLARHAPEKHAATISVALRNSFARLQRIADVLSVDSPQHAEHYVTPEKLTSEELRDILEMRSFDQEVPTMKRPQDETEFMVDMSIGI